jgi:prepilin-type N-terminal cleavage/methylation domain-containing protein
MGIQESRIGNPEARRGISGFTLIELLVAMAILMIIMLIVARIFQQAGLSWSTGVEKAESVMNGRSVADFLARELSKAVPDPSSSAFNVSGLPATFYVLDTAKSGTGAIHQVNYSASALAPDLNDSDVQVTTIGMTDSGMPISGTVTVTISNNVFHAGFIFLNRDRNHL